MGELIAGKHGAAKPVVEKSGEVFIGHGLQQVEQGLRVHVLTAVLRGQFRRHLSPGFFTNAFAQHFQHGRRFEIDGGKVQFAVFTR